MALAEELTSDGQKVQFTNHFGNALLAKLLLTILPKTAQQLGMDVEVVSLSSVSHRMAPRDGIVFPAVKTNMEDYARYG